MVTLIAEEDDFQAKLKEVGDKLVVVDFFANWCGPCKMIAPTIEGWATGDYKDVVFLKVDVDESAELAEEQGVSAMPTFILFKNGEKIETIVGADKAKLQKKIDDLK